MYHDGFTGEGKKICYRQVVHCLVNKVFLFVSFITNSDKTHDNPDKTHDNHPSSVRWTGIASLATHTIKALHWKEALTNYSRSRSNVYGVAKQLTFLQSEKYKNKPEQRMTLSLCFWFLFLFTKLFIIIQPMFFRGIFRKKEHHMMRDWSDWVEGMKLLKNSRYNGEFWGYLRVKFKL